MAYKTDTKHLFCTIKYHIHRSQKIIYRYESLSPWVRQLLSCNLTTHKCTFSTLDSATGFIGFPVAQALSRAGHIVYGQTRSQEKAIKLAAEESMILNFLLKPRSVLMFYFFCKSTLSSANPTRRHGISSSLLLMS
jgi:hypothetical protein